MLGFCHAVCHLIQLLLGTGDINGRRCAGEVLLVQHTAVCKCQIRSRSLDLKGIGFDFIKGHIHCSGRNGLDIELFVFIAADRNGKLFRAGRGDIFHHSRCRQIVRINVAHLGAVALDLDRHVLYVIVDDTESVFLGRSAGNFHFQRHMVQGTGCGRINGNGDHKPENNGNRHRSCHHCRTALVQPLEQCPISAAALILL